MVLLSIDFSCNYKSKQCHEIQSAQFGHKTFTLFTAACCVKGHTDEVPKPTTAKDTVLVVLPADIISTQLIHKINTSFSCSSKLLDLIRDILIIDILPGHKKVHFWSNSCCSQFMSQYVSWLLYQLPSETSSQLT